MSVKNNSDIVNIMPIYLPGDTPTFSTTVVATPDAPDVSNPNRSANAMASYRNQKQNNWLFGNPAAEDMNNWSRINAQFQSRFINQSQGAGRSLETAVNEASRWAENNSNLLLWIGGGLVGVIVLKNLLGSNRRRR